MRLGRWVEEDSAGKGGSSSVGSFTHLETLFWLFYKEDVGAKLQRGQSGGCCPRCTEHIPASASCLRGSCAVSATLATLHLVDGENRP